MGTSKAPNPTLVAHQPPYLPHAGFVDKVAQADVWVVQDDVQFARADWQHRNRIRTAAGWRWLTIPVHAHGRPRIDEVTVADRLWARRHRRAVEQWYRRSPYRERLAPLWELAHELRGAPLWRITLEMTQLLLRQVGVTTPAVLESGLGLTEAETRTPTDRLIALCRRLGCATYLSGPGGRSYLDEPEWAASGLELRWQQFTPPRYGQLHPGFVSGLSVVDLLLCDADPARRLWPERPATAEAA